MGARAFDVSLSVCGVQKGRETSHKTGRGLQRLRVDDEAHHWTWGPSTLPEVDYRTPSESDGVEVRIGVLLGGPVCMNGPTDGAGVFDRQWTSGSQEAHCEDQLRRRLLRDSQRQRMRYAIARDVLGWRNDQRHGIENKGVFPFGDAVVGSTSGPSSRPPSTQSSPCSELEPSPPRHHTHTYPRLSGQTLPTPNRTQSCAQARAGHPRSRWPNSNPECRPLEHYHAQRKRSKVNGWLIGAASNNASQQNASTHTSQLPNISVRIRVFRDKTFGAIGYGGVRLSIAYGSLGADEERLKVDFVFLVES